VDIYHIWCNLKKDISDMEFCQSASSYLDSLKENGHMVSYRITRKKLGFAPAELGEFHLILEFSDLTQLDNAFKNVSSRSEPIESFHHAVNSKVTNFSSALYRDFPDSHRQEGEEKF